MPFGVLISTFEGPSNFLLSPPCCFLSGVPNRHPPASLAQDGSTRRRWAAPQSGAAALSGSRCAEMEATSLAIAVASSRTRGTHATAARGVAPRACVCAASCVDAATAAIRVDAPLRSAYSTRLGSFVSFLALVLGVPRSSLFPRPLVLLCSLAFPPENALSNQVALRLATPRHQPSLPPPPAWSVIGPFQLPILKL